MSLYTITDTTLTNIADAIRTKTEKTDPILVEDMSEEILSITGGGGGDDYTYPFECIWSAPGGQDTYTYTIQEAGQYLAFGGRIQNMGLTITLSSGITVIGDCRSYTREKLVAFEANVGDTVTFSLVNSRDRGAWICKMNVTILNLFYSRYDDGSGAKTFVNQNTDKNVFSVIITGNGTDTQSTWSEGMCAYLMGISGVQAWILHGTDKKLPSISYSGGDGYQIIFEVDKGGHGGGGGDAKCDRLFYAQGYDNWQVEIPTIASLITGEKYSEYVSYDTTTKKFTALKDFTAVIVAWVYAYQTYEASVPDGAFYVNSTKLAQYEASAKAAGSIGGVRLIYNLKQGDTFYPYTPTTDGYPRQYCKVYAISDIDDDVFTYTNEEAT